jgi:MFS family permease
MNAVGDFFAAVRGRPARVFGICLFGLILSNIDQSFFGYAIPGLVAEFGVGIDVIGYVLAISFAFAAAATLPIGIAADRHGRRKVFAICMVVPAFLVGLTGLAPEIISLTVVRAAAFTFTAALVPLATTYVVEVTPDRYRGLFAGLLQLGFPLGWFIASLASAPMLEAYGWRSIFLPAFLVIPLGIWLTRKLPESDKFIAHHAEASAGGWLAHLAVMREPLLRRRIVLLTTMMFFHAGAYAGLAFFLPTFLTQARGYAEADAAMATGLSYLIGVVGYLASGIVGELYMTRRDTVAIWIAVGLGGFLGFMWLADSPLSNVLWFGFMTVFFFGVAVVQWPLGAELFPTRARATASTITGAGVMLGFAVYPVLVSQLVPGLGWPMALTVVVAPSLVLAVAAVLGLDNTKSGASLDDVARDAAPVNGNSARAA